MKKYFIVLFVSVSFLSYGQESDKKSEKASESILGNWIVKKAYLVTDKAKYVETEYPSDTISFSKEKFEIRTITADNKRQVISGEWNITTDGDLLYLNNLEWTPENNMEETQWILYVKNSKNSLRIYYRMNSVSRATKSRKDSQLTVVEYSRI